MAALRAFLQRAVPEHSSTELTSATAADGSSRSTLALLSHRTDGALRRRFLRLPSSNRRRRILLRLMHRSATITAQQERLIDDNPSELERNLPRELILRYSKDQG